MIYNMILNMNMLYVVTNLFPLNNKKKKIHIYGELLGQTLKT